MINLKDINVLTDSKGSLMLQHLVPLQNCSIPNSERVNIPFLLISTQLHIPLLKINHVFCHGHKQKRGNSTILNPHSPKLLLLSLDNCIIYMKEALKAKI
jgi:hypothetical protein